MNIYACAYIFKNFEVFLNIQKSCKNSTKKSCMPFTLHLPHFPFFRERGINVSPLNTTVYKAPPHQKNKNKNKKKPQTNQKNKKKEKPIRVLSYITVSRDFGVLRERTLTQDK